MHRPARTLTALAALSGVAVLGLGLSACGAQEGGSASPAPATVTVTETPAPAAPADDDRDDRAGGDRDRGSQAGSAGRSTGADALAAAARTALGAVGGTVVNVDQEPSGWEVDLVAPDGSETRVDVSADGGRVLGQRAETDDAEDRAENQRLLGADVDWAAALQTARTRLQADVAEIDLGEDDGTVRWEVSTPDGAGETTVVLDAGSGRVIATGTDD